MSSDTNETEKSTNGNGTPTEPSGSASTPVVRDFLYLDQEKIFSYLSQIQGGLKILFTKFQNESWHELKGPPEITREVGVDVKGDGGIKIPLLAEARVEAAAHFLNSVKSGPEYRDKGGLDGTSELFGLHHMAFDVVLNELRSRLSVSEGSIEIIDLSSFLDYLKDFPEIVKNFNLINTASKADEPPKTVKNIHYLLNRYGKGKIIVLMKDSKGKVISSFLQECHLTSPITSIIDNYGSQPNGKFVLVGVPAPNNKERVNFSEIFTGISEEGQELVAKLIDLVQNFESMSNFFQLKSNDMNVFPLALYSEL